MPMQRGSGGSGFFSPRFEKPFGFELGFELLECNLQRARAFRFQIFCRKLKIAAFLENRHPPAQRNLHPIFGAKTQQPRL